MPDTIAPNHADWLPAQPYGALIHIRPYDAVSNPKPALIRYLNAGSVSYPFHPHGSDEQLIARDGRPAQGPGGQDLSFSNFLIDVAPGQTVDTLMIWKDAEHWDADANPIPVLRCRPCRTRSSAPARRPGSRRTRTSAAPRASCRRVWCRTTSAASTTTSRTATRWNRPPTTGRASAE